MSKNQLRIALLTNFVPPYRLPFFEYLSQKVGHLKIFISTKMESNRSWSVDWGDLDISVQKSFSKRQRWKHPKDFSEEITVHFPYSTIFDLGSFKPDVVISAEMGFRTLQAMLYKKIFPSCKLIVWATLSNHTELGRSKLRLIARNLVIKSVDAIITNGKSGANYLNRYGIPKEKVFIVPQVIDSGRFHASDKAYDGSEINLLYVGQLIPRKGLHLFLPTLLKWARNNQKIKISLLIAGEGPVKPVVETESVPDNLSIKYIGHVSYDDLPEIYKKSTIFVFPTLADEWGIVVNEAMASGLPVLGSIYSQSVEELVEEGSTGWLFRTDFPQEMYNAIDKALTTSRNELNRMGQRAMISVQSQNIEFSANKFLDAINHVIGETIPD